MSIKQIGVGDTRIFRGVMSDNFHIFSVCFIICLTLIPSTAVFKDIVVVIDTSQSVSQDDLKDAVDFVYNVTEWLTIGPSDILLSVITFATDVIEQFPFSSYSNKSEVLNAIDNLKSITPNGATYTFDALTYVKTTSFLSVNGGRSNASKVVIVMTDGKSSNYPLTKSEADSIRSNLLAEVFAIGIGASAGSSSNNIEIPAIASDPDDYYTYYVQSYELLCSLILSIVPKLDPVIISAGVASCPDSTTTQSTTTTDIITYSSQANVASIAGIAAAVLLLLLVASLITVFLVKKRKNIPKLSPLEQKTIEAVKQYTEMPIRQERDVFDTSLLTNVPSIGPQEFTSGVISPSDFTLVQEL